MGAGYTGRNDVYTCFAEDFEQNRTDIVENLFREGKLNKRPGKCNLFGARKMLEISKYSDHFSGTEYAGNGLYIPHFLEYLV